MVDSMVMTQNLRSKLKEHLTKDIPVLDGKELWIWGAGDTTQLAMEGIKRLGWNIVGICDGRKYGVSFNGYKVEKPEMLKGKDEVFVLISSRVPETIVEIKKALSEINVEGECLDAVILKQNVDKVLECFDCLNDDRSKNVYANVIITRLIGMNPDDSFVDENEYFAVEGFDKSSENEVYVDCGAWIGDVEENFLNRFGNQFKKIIAFELDKDNYEKLKANISILNDKYGLDNNKVEAYQLGVGNNNEEIHYESYKSNQGVGSKIISNSDLIEDSRNCELIENRMVTIDNFISEEFTWLKADIESFEYNMLIGAKESIKRYHPKLTICLYHNAVDLYDIVLLLKEYCSLYKFDIRHHAKEEQAGTVLYARV